MSGIYISHHRKVKSYVLSVDVRAQTIMLSKEVSCVTERKKTKISFQFFIKEYIEWASC